MLKRKTKESSDSLEKASQLGRPPLNMEWLAKHETSNRIAYSSNVQSKLSQRVIKTLMDGSNQHLLGDEDTQLTGAESLEIILKLSNEIKSSTPLKGRVAILFPPSLAQSLSILSAIAADRVPVILNHWVDEKSLNHMITENDFHALVTFPQQYSDKVPLIPQIEFNDHLQIVKSNKRGFFDRPVPDADTAIILHTSGSTGKSKAVKIPESAINYMVDLLIGKLHLNSESVATITLPIFHTMALITQFLPTFFAGGKSVIVNSELSTGKLYRLIQQSEGTFVALISDMLKYCKDEKNKRNLPVADKIKLIQLAGGHITPKHLELAAELFPNALIYKGYGLTEGIRVSMISSDDPLFSKDSAGYPLPEQSVMIRDENDQNMPIEQNGEILVKGPNLMSGYEGNTQARFTEDGYLRTGDFGHITKEGLIVIQGRKDNVFKSNGRKIACKELEQIAIELPQVLKTKCIAVPCDQKGQRPVLIVELNEGEFDLMSKDWKNSLVRILKENLDPYKVPKDVIVTSIPKLANGKINQTATTKIWDRKESFTYLGKASFGCHFHAAD